MIWPLVIMGGMALLQGAQQNKQQKSQARMNNIMGRHQEMQQERNNAAARAAGDRDQNVVTENLQSTYRDVVNQKVNIDMARAQARAEAVVQSAAAGTAGMSVDDQLFDIERNASKANENVDTALLGAVKSLQDSRVGIEATVEARKNDNIFLPSKAPSLGSALGASALNFAASTYGTAWGA